MTLRPRHRRSRVVVAVALCLAVAGGSQALAAPDDDHEQPPDQEVDQAVDADHPHADHDHGDHAASSDGAGTLEDADLDVTQGRDAVEQLERTGTLDDVADDVGLDPEELREELLHDSSMFVTGTGFVGYADTAEWSPVPPAAALSVAELPANVFDLNSRPTSSRVIYLDFDGHTANDPAWASVGFPAIASAPFDIDGVPSSFSAAEQALIYEVWQRVAEDYRAFDVNITTRDPGLEGIRRTSTVDAAYGQRVVVTPSNFAGGSVIGVALLDVFGSDADHAAYVFTDVGFKQTAKTMAEAVSHEAGHTFGLSHDGGPLSPNYYDGHGVWAPIMGRPDRSDSPGTAVVAWRVRRRQQFRRRPVDHRQRQGGGRVARRRVPARRPRQHRWGADGRAEQRCRRRATSEHRRPRRVRRRRTRRHASRAGATADG